MSFIIGLPSSGGGATYDIPQVKGTCINWLPDGQGLLTAGVNQTSTRIKGIPFPVKGNIDCLGVNLQVQNISTATLHLAIYKYDYTNDIWNKATDQLDINITATGVILQTFSTPQSLDAGFYCVAFRDSDSTGDLTGVFKNRSQNKYLGAPTGLDDFYNTMRTVVLSYSPTMPSQITFPISEMQENNYHELFQIQF